MLSRKSRINSSRLVEIRASTCELEQRTWRTWYIHLPDRRSYFAQLKNGDDSSTSNEIDHRPGRRGQFIMIS